MRSEGLTQEEIGEKISWSENKVKQYNVVLNQIVTQTLEKTKQHQKGRVTSDVAIATKNFTEGRFRNSGLYDLEGI